VNLDRSVDRLRQFCDVNRHLTSVSRFPAIDGSEINLSNFVQQGSATADILTMFSRGALGCAMSNLALWDKSIANQRVVTIAEDDAIFNYNFEQRAQELLNNLPTDWHIVYWGFNFDMFVCFELLPGVSRCIATFDEEQMRAATLVFQRSTITPQAFKAVWVFGTTCYSISPRGAELIKKRVLPLRPQVIPLPQAKGVPPYSPAWRTVGIDNSINALHREINSFICFPPLVISKNDPQSSTVRGSA
jgi:GR25 family glycosyltransferase involved in LPS biosynthesis